MTLGMLVHASLSIGTRSSSENIGCLDGFSSAPTTTDSKVWDARADDVEMTVRHGIERPRTQGGQAHHTSTSPGRFRDRNSMRTLSP